MEEKYANQTKIQLYSSLNAEKIKKQEELSLKQISRRQPRNKGHSK